MDHLTWTCHICGEERPDRLISVRSKTVKHAGFTTTENVRYCNDRITCSTASLSFSHFKGVK